ncbi:TPA_asm: DUF1493 family protein [Salmonella enterica subsp. enterica serovar Abortusovis]|nr:DUF1493 family protein [Salmonella enterica subsp. enterica serovar Abortusovis]
MQRQPSQGCGLLTVFFKAKFRCPEPNCLNPFRKNDIPQVPDFTIGMLIESAGAGRWLYD